MALFIGQICLSIILVYVIIMMLLIAFHNKLEKGTKLRKSANRFISVGLVVCMVACIVLVFDLIWSIK